MQVALKRQQAVEDAIALRLAANETGTELKTLPPGQIYGMTVTEPRHASPTPSDCRSISMTSDSESGPTSPAAGPSSGTTTTTTTTVSQTALDMLSQLFPHRKRSVLELILRRCDLDLLRAIEQCSPQQQQQHQGGTSGSESVLFRNFSQGSRASAFEGVSSRNSSVTLTPSTAPLNPQLPTDLSSTGSISGASGLAGTPSSPHYGPLIAYPKWLLPMSIPVTMGHLPNLMPRCSMPNCPMCLH